MVLTARMWFSQRIIKGYLLEALQHIKEMCSLTWHVFNLFTAIPKSPLQVCKKKIHPRYQAVYETVLSSYALRKGTTKK